MARVGLLAAAILASVAVSATAQEATVEERIEQLERKVNNQSLLEMLERLNSLQNEVELLRGQVEEQQHIIEGLKSRQRELYLDVDRRISRIEREGGGGGLSAMTPDSTQSLTTAGGTGEVTTPTPEKKGEGSEEALQKEREAYQAAFDMLRELRYAQATTAFRDFLKQYPNGRYAHIAQYWLGEAGYAQRDFRQAINDYNALLVNHPESPKLPEAMLKMGYSYYELKEMDNARKILEQLLQEYPKTTEAGQARNLLKRIDRNGG